MNASRLLSACLLLCGLTPCPSPLVGPSGEATAAPGTSAGSPPERDGQHDFDAEIGSWKTHVSRLAQPLRGSSAWVEYEGTSVVRSLCHGRANLVELDVAGPAGRIEGLSLRLYDPEARRWSLNFSNIRSGTLSPPTSGGFRNGRGEFFGQETLGGRAIYVRFLISKITPNVWRFEQAFSADGGATWETNWIATDTRISAEPDQTR